jgi:hypothetical protein
MRLALTFGNSPKDRYLRISLSIPSAAFVSLLFAAPAHAAETMILPEPGSLTLLSLGVAGLIIGRRAARKPPKD